MMEGFLQIATTVDKKEDAERIAGVLVEKRLAACVQILGPITSTYRWQGRIETSEEWLIQIKSSRALYGEVEEVIKELHPYEVPEIIAVPIVEGSRDYLKWMEEELKKK